MRRKSRSGFDEIGYWSEVKLDILREYAHAYSTILTAQKKKAPFSHSYIDGFAGSGVQFSKSSRSFVPGSPLNALLVQPPFDSYYLIDLDGDKVEALRKHVAGRENVRLLHGDCNRVLLEGSLSRGPVRGLSARALFARSIWPSLKLGSH